MQFHRYFHHFDFVELGVLIVGIIIAGIALAVAIKSNRYQAINLILTQLNNRTNEANLSFRRNADIDQLKQWSGVLSPMVAGIQQFDVMKKHHRRWLKGYSDDFFKNITYLNLDTKIREQVWKISFDDETLYDQTQTFRMFFANQHENWDLGDSVTHQGKG